MIAVLLAALRVVSPAHQDELHGGDRHLHRESTFKSRRTADMNLAEFVDTLVNFVC